MALIPKLNDTALMLDLGVAIIVLSLIALFLYRHKKKVNFEKMLFPFLYAFLYRGQFGIKRMERFVEKNKEIIKIFGYSSIGFGFAGMIGATIMVFYVIIKAILQPTQTTLAPFLPFVNIPVLGYISFSHWIITILIVVIIHESAHGIVAIAHGLKIKNTGAGIFAVILPFIPAAFVEPDERELKKKSDVVQYSIFAAGPISNFLLLIPLLLISILIIAPIESNITYQDGVIFDVIPNENYPAFNTGVNNGTIINYVNGEKINSYEDFFRELYWVKAGQEINLTYLNKNKNISNEYLLKAIPHPDFENRGFIGVTSIHNNVLIKESAKPYSGIFSWFKGLIILLIEITFSLGLINLFPASITDGGRMFSLALNRINKNKKINKRITGFFALIFIGLITYAFIRYFIGLI